MRTFVFYIFLAACGGASTEAAVTITPPPAQPVVASPAAPSVTVAVAQPTAAPNRPTSIPGTKIRFEGGDGANAKAAIVIRGAAGESDGVAAEYKYLEMLHGRRGVDFKVGSQSLMQDGPRSLDRLDVALKDGTTFELFFDITDYFGKF